MLVAGCGPVEEPIEVEQSEQALATLSGVLLDWDDQPVAHADIALAINGAEATERVLTDEQGRYALKVSVKAIAEARQKQQEITLLMYSPYEDRGAVETFEGDRIRLLPVTLREFVDMDDLTAGATVNVRTAYVPLQAQGYKITPELIANGGELTWRVPNPNSLGADMLEVTLVVAPNSIVVDGDDPQDEITLTVLDAERAPMQIPGDGFGVLWTIQPRDVRFDPPAKLKLVGERLSLIGLAEVEAGTAFDLFGATLDRGWQRYGDVSIQGMDGLTMTIESEHGVIPRGAWGHVLANPASDAGMLVTCQTPGGDPQPCCTVSARAIGESGLGIFPIFASLADEISVSISQQDYQPGNNPGDVHYDRLFWYTNMENRCAGCANRNPRHEWKNAQMSTGLTVGDMVDVTVLAIPLCDNEIAETDIDARDAMVLARLGLFGGGIFGAQVDAGDQVDPGAGEGSTPQTDLWEEFTGVTQFPADPRVRFSRSNVFTFDIGNPLHGCP